MAPTGVDVEIQCFEVTVHRLGRSSDRQVTVFHDGAMRKAS